MIFRVISEYSLNNYAFYKFELGDSLNEADALYLNTYVYEWSESNKFMQF